MYFIVKRYVDNMSIHDLNNLAISKGIGLSKDELEFSYNYIKKNWKNVISNYNLFDIDKYKDKFKEDMVKNPDKYFVDTPKGRMSIKEAKEQGFDPTTKRFKKKKDNSREEMLSQVNEKDQEAIRKLMDPSQLGLAPADAEGLGVKPDSPMVKQASPLGQPAQAPTPMSPPNAGPVQAQGTPDINTLLGGM